MVGKVQVSKTRDWEYFNSQPWVWQARVRHIYVVFSFQLKVSIASLILLSPHWFPLSCFGGNNLLSRPAPIDELNF